VIDLRTPRILWSSLTLTPGIYLGILWTLHVHAPAPPDALVWGLFGAAAFTAILCGALPRRLHQQAIERARFEVVEEPDPAAPPTMLRENATLRRVFADASKVRAQSLAPYQTSFIIGMALAEAIAIFGLVLGMLGGAWNLVLPFFAVAWILMAAQFPTTARVLSPIEQLYRAKL
jgi:hypothetical protein